MEWLFEILKHITISRSFTGAVFLTSASLLFGPNIFPDFFEPLPRDWKILSIGALIFSGVILLVWLIPALYKSIKKHISIVLKFILSRSLTDNEEALIKELANFADESLDLRQLDYTTGSVSKLEIFAIAASLSKKGLVAINPYEENLIQLSRQGRFRAIQIIKAKNTPVNK